jgi:hypothetical protein
VEEGKTTEVFLGIRDILQTRARLEAVTGGRLTPKLICSSSQRRGKFPGRSSRLARDGRNFLLS